MPLPLFGSATTIQLERFAEDVSKECSVGDADTSYVKLYQCPVFEATRWLFRDGPRNFEPRPASEDDTSAGTPSPSFRATQTGGRLVTAYGLVRSNRHYTRRSSVESGFEPATFRSRGRDLTTTPPRPQQLSC
ncbi:hypothetical protein AVEN_110291-1 [Araneus ventricosus]|uniref:Uncharacterized protein n=1 Tax=Araneus ventricosus TaxID=182803 RepID=A0A4Y2DR41_ARAVE|nr:hypothetical protein AVEN_110291-1 [Araneus ventricosus]